MSVRLFAALDLPAEARTALHDWAAPAARADPALRPLTAEALHVTLVFLGPQPEERVGEIAALVAAADVPLPALEVTGAAFLPPRRPGVLVADLTAPAELATLQAGLAAALRPYREPEDRAYRPHVTVARVRRGKRPRDGEPPAPPPLRFAPAGVVLYRSLPRRGGAVYEPVG